MKSTVAVTSEIDDLALAAQELCAQIDGKLKLQRSCVGIIYCDADVEVGELGRLLHKRLGINIVGLTTTACMERSSGYQDMGIMLCVLTADDVNFIVGSTGELEVGGCADDCAAVIGGTYRRARAELDADPALIYMFAPYCAGFPMDNYIRALDAASGGVPVFGGVATDHYDLKYQKTFCNGEAFDRGLVFVLIEGNVRPIFAMEHSFGGKVEKRGVVTKSSGSFVEKIGEQTFKEFVGSIVPIPDEETVVFHFQSTPFIVELPDFDKDEQPVVRAVCTVDRQTGAGGFLCNIPEGSSVYLNILQRENLRESCTAALKKIIGELRRTTDYEYSMLFISTCNARHLLMGDTKDMESELVRELLGDSPPALNAMGFYGFGEFCPTGGRADGSAKNRSHNISLAVCAI